LINIEEGLIQEYYNREHQKSELHVQNDFHVKQLVRISPRSFIYIIFLDNKLKLLLNSVSSGLFLIEIDNGQIPSSSINTRGNAKFIISINRNHPLTNSYIDYLNPYSLKQDLVITIKNSKVTLAEL
jgi:hypothetical protein